MIPKEKVAELYHTFNEANRAAVNAVGSILFLCLDVSPDGKLYGKEVLRYS